MFKNFLPNKILSINNKLINNLISLMIVILFIGFIYAIFISPPDYIQGDAVRIMYVHVPSSFISLGCFALIGIASILNLIFKIKFMPLIAKSLAPIGAVFTLISIATGSLWGKPTWGVWWVWDARLTSMAILFCFYIAYMLTWKLITKYEKAKKVSTIIAILGLFNLPVIKYSVDWWNTLHQASSITLTSSPTIHYTMLFPLLIMLFGLAIYSLVIFLMQYKSELIKFKISNKKK